MRTNISFQLNDKKIDFKNKEKLIITVQNILNNIKNQLIMKLVIF